ncbi:MAG: flagellar biosynthesis anti-sigma factor FlgM [Treponema sp.]|jgi:negative regulator of flagellin synthesis FlgM|nr:flagellar biosynthesis anti-sigma factor FlgM [Treponema sp.]
MMIDRIGYTEPIQSGKRPGRNEPVTRGSPSDSISLSPEALEKAEIYRAADTVAAAPDVRAERVAELKAKINDPSYIDERLLEATADKIMESFGLV